MENFISSAFESIGFLVVIVIVVIAVIAMISRKSESQNEIITLANHSPKCRSFELENHNNEVNILKEYQRILSDPKERNIAEKRYNEHLVKEKEKTELKKKEKIKHRVFAYSYEIQILEIFDTKYELTKEEIINGLCNKIKITSWEADNLISLLLNNEIIQKDFRNSNIYQIGDILTKDAHVVSETDLSQKEWLSRNGKVIDPKVIGVYNFHKK
ncbi:MAG: hypothetical protein JNK09_02915 [Prolixibacteraceae bacterium]|nr:hypothetical protein [Prolixibacteraceae bacterium]